MVLIFSQHISPRLSYVLDFVFKNKNIDYRVTQSVDEFIDTSAHKVNYSSLDLKADLTIIPEGLLFEADIRNNIKVEFKSTSENWVISQSRDDFSIIFFFLTCYEEYYISNRDEHDRFSAQNSTLYKFNRLHKPNIDLIVIEIWSILKLDYSDVRRHFKSILTFDIDSAWAVKNKSKTRAIASDLKSLIKNESISEKKAIRKKIIKDPFDTFDKIKTLSKEHEIICFFLLGDWGKFDKNINWKNKELQCLINDLASAVKIGIHPSYKSYLSTDLVKTELSRLDQITGSNNCLSRQHFLKLKLPTTYEILASIGIKEDYSMGFADAYGFRAGTAFSFNFYNLKTDSESELRIYPISYMDGTLNQYLKHSIEESISIVQQLKSEIKHVGGLFIPLWHNDTINNKGIWKGWNSVFESNLVD